MFTTGFGEVGQDIGFISRLKDLSSFPTGLEGGIRWAHYASGAGAGKETWCETHHRPDLEIWTTVTISRQLATQP